MFLPVVPSSLSLSYCDHLLINAALRLIMAAVVFTSVHAATAYFDETYTSK